MQDHIDFAVETGMIFANTELGKPYYIDLTNTIAFFVITMEALEDDEV